MTEHARRRLDVVDGKAWVAFAIDGQPGVRTRWSDPCLHLESVLGPTFATCGDGRIWI
jgi:hypothetical protein